MKHIKFFETFSKVFEDTPNQESKVDLYEIAQEMEEEELLPNITNTESEGPDVLRIDFGEDESIWLYQNGSVDGAQGLSPEAKDFLVSKGFEIPEE